MARAAESPRRPRYPSTRGGAGDYSLSITSEKSGSASLCGAGLAADPGGTKLRARLMACRCSAARRTGGHALADLRPGFADPFRQRPPRHPSGHLETSHALASDVTLHDLVNGESRTANVNKLLLQPSHRRRRRPRRTAQGCRESRAPLGTARRPLRPPHSSGQALPHLGSRILHPLTAVGQVEQIGAGGAAFPDPSPLCLRQFVSRRYIFENDRRRSQPGSSERSDPARGRRPPTHVRWAQVIAGARRANLRHPDIAKRRGARIEQSIYDECRHSTINSMPSGYDATGDR